MKTYREFITEASSSEYKTKLKKDKDGDGVIIVFKNGKEIARAYHDYHGADDFLVTMIKTKKQTYVDNKEDIIDAVKKMEGKK